MSFYCSRISYLHLMCLNQIYSLFFSSNSSSIPPPPSPQFYVLIIFDTPMASSAPMCRGIGQSTEAAEVATQGLQT